LDRSVRRIPLLSGSRVVVVPAGDEDVVLPPPPPPAQVVDVAAAVRDALRFPLTGPALDAIVPRGGRATIVVQPPTLPFPGAQVDPRREALAAAVGELERCGVSDERQTILVAGGLGRYAGHRELERLLPPPRARSFRGRVLVHDAEDEGLEQLGNGVRIHPALVETDLALVLGAAETILHGGPGTLVAACDARTVRRMAGADSLLEAAATPEWRSALAIEGALGRKVPLLGVSLVLDVPRLTGTFRGYPDRPDAVRRVARSPFRAALSLLPDVLRRDLLSRLGRRLEAAGAFAGPPSVAHSEALLRAITLRTARLDEPVDALVVAVPWGGPQLPRGPLNPVAAAALAFGLALRLRRDAFPVRRGGTVVLLHSLRRSFVPAEAPYAGMFHALRASRTAEELTAAERSAAVDEPGLAAYRAGKTCHPLLPYADWAGCAPALGRLGRVLVAGCRDALAARTLGFVPSHGIASALEMAHGVAGGRARIAILLGPPYPALLVGSS
jgi:hypothetical protein